jgi:hypothetical protein
MIARIRKIKDKEIVILNYSNFKLNDSIPWVYDEVKQGLILTDELMLKEGADNRYYLSLFQENYIHNRLEELNKQKYYFLDVFKRIGVRKGFDIEILEREPKHKRTTRTASSVASSECDDILSNDGSSSTLSKGIINDHISSAEDIDSIGFDQLNKFQKQCTLTREDHYKLAKHFIKIHTGLDTINNEIVRLFRHTDLVYNFACLIDDANVRSKDPIKHSENLMKLNYVRTIINKLGYQSAFDKSLIRHEKFETSMNNVIEYLTNEYSTNKRFNMIMNKTKHNIRNMRGKSLKAMLGYINSFFSIYGLKISTVQKQEGSYVKKTNYYKLQCLYNVDELLEYRINKGYKFEDNDNIFIKPSTINGYQFQYKDMVNERDIQHHDDESDEDSDIYDPTSFDDLVKTMHSLDV